MDVAFVLLERDARVDQLCVLLPYNQSTLYRALIRLEEAGFATRVKSRETAGALWTINSAKCPVLYRATRR